jgi:hypothetical protein
MNECTRELVCDRTAYESPEARGDKQHNMHGLKNKMQILHVSLICFYFYLNAILPLSEPQIST